MLKKKSMLLLYIISNTTLLKLFWGFEQEDHSDTLKKRGGEGNVGIFILLDSSLATFIRANNSFTLIDANSYFKDQIIYFFFNCNFI